MHPGEGVFGALVVREAEHLLEGAYDVDRNVFMLSDWTHVDTRVGGVQRPPLWVILELDGVWC